MLGVVGVGGGWRIPSGEEEGEDWGRGTVTCDSQAHDTNLQAPKKSACNDLHYLPDFCYLLNLKTLITVRS